MFNARLPLLEETWIEIDGQACGAQPGGRGPIGGGSGYTGRPDPTGPAVSTLDELLEALSGARVGDVIAIDG